MNGCGLEWSIIILDVVESVVNACKIPNIFFMVASKLIGTYFGHLLLFSKKNTLLFG